jgi:AraC-like DNA-binding protein
MIHYALKMDATETLHHQINANARITSIFSELLERQFPIDSTDQRFTMRSPKDFADQLYVHINHLNRAVKETTGKTTSALIATRLVSEAKALLKHTNWSITEIGYSLGFEEPAHFNNFFRKHAEVSPSAFRSS